MPRNDRIFYACQAVLIVGKTGVDPASKHIARGLQSVGMNANYSLDQVFEIGQLELYENIEDVADTEVSLEKVIDGEPLLYTMASNKICETSLAGAAKNRCDVYLAIFDDGLDNATGVARNVCWNSGMFISSVGYSYNVEGNSTETLSLAGIDRFWNDQANETGDTATAQFSGNPTNGQFGSDTPNSGVVRRVNVDVAGSTIPQDVKNQIGDNPVGLGGALRLQTISVNAEFGTENLLELGRFGPYAKYASFPIEVTCEFEVIATSGDVKSVSGVAPNLTDETILLKDTAGTVLDLGTKNKLTGVSYSGGDAGGDNATVSYSYQNFNNLLVADGGGYTPD